MFDEIQNTKKMKTRESKERRFGKKSNRNRVSFNIYMVVFAFLLSTLRSPNKRGVLISKRGGGGGEGVGSWELEMVNRVL